MTKLEAKLKREKVSRMCRPMCWRAAKRMAARSPLCRAEFFENTGLLANGLLPTEAKLRTEVRWIARRCGGAQEDYGRAVAKHILAWSQDDGGAVVETMGFPQYELTKGLPIGCPPAWLRSSKNRFCRTGARTGLSPCRKAQACALPPHPEYSEDKASAFYKEALEVYEAKQNLTPERRAIARFWADDPMLSMTPPGHWISIALQIMERDKVALGQKC